MKRPRELFRTLQLFPVRTPTLLPATHTNSYALGEREILLVEPSTPYDDEQRAWLAWARELGSSGRSIVGILATHHHPDHVGGAGLLSRELGLPIWAHPETAKRVDVPVARLLDDGEEIVLRGPKDERWRVLHTPGHAPGHVCLFEPRTRTAIVGDMVASVGTILIAPGDGDMAIYLDQLRRLAALDAALALPAHGEPIDAPTATFERYVTHRLMREEKILDALRELTRTGEGPSGTNDASDASDARAEELVPVAYADTPKVVWPIAKISVDAHLEKLERDGRVARGAREGAFRVVD
jgi:endoribonuclease LACTB2